MNAVELRPVDYLEGLMEGFVAYDADWRMTYMNASAERILGCRRAEVLGKTLEDQRRSRQAGFDAHLVKPVAHEALLALLSAPRRH